MVKHFLKGCHIPGVVIHTCDPPEIAAKEKEVEELNKFVLLAAIVALVLAVSVPAVAADVTESGSVVLGGDGSQQCVPGEQFGNVGTGRIKQPFTQEYSTADDLSAGGSTVSFVPVESGPCTQQVQGASGSTS